MKKRELKRAIIRTIRSRELYGYELRKILASQGVKLQLSYIYKTLKEMSDEGFLESDLRRGGYGPQRRLYRLTEQGRRELGKIFGEAQELIHDFYEEYVSNLPPAFFSDRFRMMMREVYGGRESMALVISEPLTYIHRELLETMCLRAGGKRTYLVKPSSIRAEVDFPNLTVLEGSLDDIPLKEKSLDALVVVDIQDAVNLVTCCREFRRVLKSGSVLFGCAPFMGLGDVIDPLEVGEFMKKMKYSLTGRPYLDKETIKKALGENFDYVDIASIGFLTAFISGFRSISK